MNEPSRQPRATQALYTMAAFVIVIAGIKSAESIMVTFLLSAFFAIICAVPFLMLQRRGLPAWLSIILVVLTIGLMQVLLITIITTSVKDFSANLPIYQEKLRSVTLQGIAIFQSWGIEVPTEKILDTFNPGNILKASVNALGSLGSVLSDSFLIILTVIFMLFEGMSLPKKLKLAFGENSPQIQYLRRFMGTVKRYMSIKAMVSLITGVIVYVALKIIGVDYPLLWSLLAFLLNFVPNIGSIIAAVPPVILALVQLGSLSALMVALVYVAINMIVGNWIEPRYMGKGLGLSTLIVFMSLVFWGWILGPVGMFLSVPLTMLLKIAFETSEDTLWISILMGSDADEEPIKA
jgi:predicted PurR-regulated permease PerM